MGAQTQDSSGWVRVKLQLPDSFSLDSVSGTGRASSPGCCVDWIKGYKRGSPTPGLCTTDICFLSLFDKDMLADLILDFQMILDVSNSRSSGTGS